MGLERGTFQIGNVVQPLSAATTNSALKDVDPALWRMLDFCAAMLATHAGARWAAETVIAQLPNTSIVADKVPYDPIPQLQSTQFKLPLLAIYRASNAQSEKSTVRESSNAKWFAMWIMPTLQASQAERLDPFRKAVGDILHDRIQQGFDPSQQSGANIAELSGVERIAVLGTRFGRLPAPANLYFPAVMVDLIVSERQSTPANAYTPLAGIDTQVDMVPRPGDGDPVAPFIEFQTPSP